MARSILAAVRQIKAEVAQFLSPRLIREVCTTAGHVWRDRLLDPATTVHLFVLQILNGNTAILHLRHLAGSAVNAAAYCRARMRLPLAVYRTLLDYTAGLASQDCAPIFANACGQAMRVLLVDATSSLTPDTRSIRKLFAQPANIKPGAATPWPRCWRCSTPPAGRSFSR